MQLTFSLTGNENLACHLAEAGGWGFEHLDTGRFTVGESYVWTFSDVADRPVNLVDTSARSGDGFLRLAFAADAARALDASEVTLVAPYLVYTRQDQRSQSGKTVSSKCFSRLVSSTFDRLVTVAPHLHQYSALHSIPSHTPYAVPLLAHWIAAEIEERLIIRPNEESVQWVLEFARRIGAPNVLLRKIRHGDRNLDVERPELPHYARSSQGIIEVEILS